MLEELIVLNGELSPKYDRYNNKYTVKINNDVTKLQLSYVKDDDVKVSVYGNNNLQEGSNNVLVVLSKDNKTEYIFLNILKEESKEIFNEINNSSSLEISNSVPIYAGPLITTSCFLLIITVFLFLFGKKRQQ